MSRLLTLILRFRQAKQPGEGLPVLTIVCRSRRSRQGSRESGSDPDPLPAPDAPPGEYKSPGRLRRWQWPVFSRMNKL